MKKFFCSSLLLILLLMACVSADARAWYEGGTLHSVTVGEWKKATYQNKLATCGDMVANFWRNDLANFEVKNIPDDFKPYAQELVNFIDTSTEGIDEVNHYKVSEIAAMGAIMMGWGKQEKSSAPAEEPVAPLKSAENADKKLQENGFLLEEEIEEIWQNEVTPDVLEKLTEKQMKAIDTELKQAQDVASKSSLDFGKGIKDSLERSMYQEGVRKNKVLKATREIAKKYGIKVGDVFVVSNHLFLENSK